MTAEESVLDPRIIERDMERATKFLRTLSVSPEIRRAMALLGYGQEDHKRGWKLLLTVLGELLDLDVPLAGNPAVAQEAIGELDAWDGPNFARARAALEHHFAAQARYVFRNLKAQTGAASVGAVKTFVDRAVALRDGSDPERADSREEDRAAWELLGKRRILDDEKVTWLRGRIEAATQLAPEPVEVPDPTEDPEYQAAAAELHGWLTDWRETARAGINKRAYKIRLGLTVRRQNAPPDEQPGDEGG